MRLEVVMNFAYIRVSSKEQNESRQVKAINEYVKKENIVIEDKNVFIDKASGKSFDRPIYIDMKNRFRKGDVLLLKELDRLGRDMDDIKREWHSLVEGGVEIVVIDTPIISTVNKTDIERRLIANIVFELLTYMAEKERVKIRQRQAEGIKSAKEKGVQFGRPKANVQITKFKKKFEAFNGGYITAEVAASELNISRATFFRRIKEYSGQ